MNNKAHGFTIVELLIVIVVIAILAALSYVGYTSINNRAHDSAVQSDLANMAKRGQLYHAEKGQYPPISTTVLSSLEIRASKSSYDTGYNLYYCTDTSTYGTFSFAAKSKSGKVYYTSSNGSGVLQGDPVMGPARACDRIGGVEISPNNFLYAYNRETGNWAAWLK